MPDGRPWPCISVVTASYNQGQFLEEAIRSVLLQGYPNLEYIVIDDGSRDDSLEIIQKYEPWLSFWTSQENHGQSHALNRGFDISTGEIMAWLSSDDMYLPKTFLSVVNFFQSHPEADAVYGDLEIIDENGNYLTTQRPGPFRFKKLIYESSLLEPTIFWRQKLWEEAGPLDESFYYALDYELWLRFARHGRFRYIPALLARERHHRNRKTVVLSKQHCYTDCRAALVRFFSSANIPAQLKHLELHAIALTHFKSALEYHHAHSVGEAQRELQIAFEDLRLLAVTRDLLRLTVYEAMHSEKSEEFLEGFFDLLPKAHLLQKLRGRAFRRAFLLDYFRRKLQNLPVFFMNLFFQILTDPAWLIDRRIFPQLIEVLVGSKIMNHLRNLKRSKVEF